MTIEWTSLFIGLAVGILFMNIVTLISAYIKRNKARASLNASKENLKKIYEELEKGKQILIERAKEIKK